jgi:conjugative transposon TraM protein
MKQNPHKLAKHRKFLMVLPLLAMPFVAMIFWALGGGKEVGNVPSRDNDRLNLELPNAQFDEDAKAWEKLSLYQKAQRDSMKRQQARSNDPYFNFNSLDVFNDSDRGAKDSSRRLNSSLGSVNHNANGRAAQVKRKMDELYKAINGTTNEEAKPNSITSSYSEDANKVSGLTSDVDRLESMMEMMQAGGGNDKEMQEIQSMLDKVLDIQHPERVNERIREHSKKNPKQVFRVSIASDESVGLMQNQTINTDSSGTEIIEQNQFYGLNANNSSIDIPNTFAAEIYGTQVLITGSIARLKLNDDIYVNGMLIPKNQFVFGICALNGERLTVTIKSIRSGNSIFPVSLDVFDLDGLEGIYVPGALARSAVKESSNETISGLQLNTIDPTLKIQAANAGIETVKDILSKKTKLIKVSVKAGYKILLRDRGQSNN